MKKPLIIIYLLIFSFISMADIRADQDAFIKIAEKVMPAVVNINTERIVKQKYYDPFEEFNDPLFNEFFGNRSRPKEMKRKATALGSGFLISEDGYLITNNHVIEGADKIEVVLNDKTKYKARVIGKDPDTDIAVLKIDEDGKTFPYVEFGDSDEIKIGQWSIAIGNPYGLNNTMTVGIVSARGRMGMGLENYEDFIQTDASINPGNSGGPLVDIDGKVVGINTAIFSQSGGNIGIGFAIPINMAKYVKESLISTGKVERGFLGVKIQELDEEMAKKFGLEKATGALVSEVVEGSPAEKSGIKRGDVVLEIDDIKIKTFNELRNKIATIEPGKRVKIVLMRDKKKKDIFVKLDKKEDAEINMEKNKYFGMKIAELNDEIRKNFDISPDINGLIVKEIDNDSQAYELGIRPGNIIVEIENKEIKMLEDFVKIYKKMNDGESVMLYIVGKGVSRYVNIVK